MAKLRLMTDDICDALASLDGYGHLSAIYPAVRAIRETHTTNINATIRAKLQESCAESARFAGKKVLFYSDSPGYWGRLDMRNSSSKSVAVLTNNVLSVELRPVVVQLREDYIAAARLHTRFTGGPNLHVLTELVRQGWRKPVALENNLKESFAPEWARLRAELQSMVIELARNLAVETAGPIASVTAERTAKLRVEQLTVIAQIENSTAKNGIPLTIGSPVKRLLSSLGYPEEEVRRMKPAEAMKIVVNGIPARNA